jgi:uncharacterized FlgJ-related protein
MYSKLASGTLARSQRQQARVILATVFALCLAVSWAGSAAAQKKVELGSPEELLDFYETLNYTPEAWQAGIREIPRAYIMEIGHNWKVNSQNMEVIEKKRIFFRALAPLVLRSNELILEDRARLLAIAGKSSPAGEDAAWLQDLAARYKVEDGDVGELTKRVDAVPTSLVLAQGAEESGWGTSRFAAEGNALFGQWTWGGKGIAPLQQREGMGDYKIAAFDTPLESVEAYLLNINSHDSYAELRDKRAEMRSANTALSGWDLAETLTSYSERGPDYVKSLHGIMRVNKLQHTDEATLADGEVYELYPKAP